MLAQEKGMEALSVGVKVRNNHLEHMQKPWQGKKGRILGWDSRRKGRELLTGNWTGGSRFQKIFKMDRNGKWHAGTSRSL